ncbi:MAG: hypothetical protein ABW176_02250 [Candidatus Thiodiazotropha endolucinida]
MKVEIKFDINPRFFVLYLAYEAIDKGVLGVVSTLKMSSGIG